MALLRQVGKSSLFLTFRTTNLQRNGACGATSLLTSNTRHDTVTTPRNRHNSSTAVVQQTKLFRSLTLPQGTLYRSPHTRLRGPSALITRHYTHSSTLCSTPSDDGGGGGGGVELGRMDRKY